MTIIKSFETTEQKKKLSKKYIGLGLIVFLVLMITEIWVNNNVVTYGEKFERLSVLAKSLNLENQILENEIAKRQALNNIASKSAELGFSEPESIQYIR